MSLLVLHILFTLCLCLIGTVPVVLVLTPQLMARYRLWRRKRRMAKLTQLAENMPGYWNKPN